MLDNHRHHVGCCFCQCLQSGATLFNFCLYGFTYFSAVSKSCKSVSSSDPYILLLWFWSLCIKKCHILCCGLHVIPNIFQPSTACLDLSQCPNLSILSHNSFPEGALIWKLASPVYQVWNSIFGTSHVYTS
jgi:hypothetical protein